MQSAHMYSHSQKAVLQQWAVAVWFEASTRLLSVISTFVASECGCAGVVAICLCVYIRGFETLTSLMRVLLRRATLVVPHVDCGRGAPQGSRLSSKGVWCGVVWCGSLPRRLEQTAVCVGVARPRVHRLPSVRSSQGGWCAVVGLSSFSACCTLMSSCSGVVAGVWGDVVWCGPGLAQGEVLIA